MNPVPPATSPPAAPSPRPIVRRHPGRAVVTLVMPVVPWSLFAAYRTGELIIGVTPAGLAALLCSGAASWLLFDPATASADGTGRPYLAATALLICTAAALAWLSHDALVRLPMPAIDIATVVIAWLAWRQSPGGRDAPPA